MRFATLSGQCPWKDYSHGNIFDVDGTRSVVLGHRCCLPLTWGRFIEIIEGMRPSDTIDDTRRSLPEAPGQTPAPRFQLRVDGQAEGYERLALTVLCRGLHHEGDQWLQGPCGRWWLHVLDIHPEAFWRRARERLLRFRIQLPPWTSTAECTDRRCNHSGNNGHATNA